MKKSEVIEQCLVAVNEHLEREVASVGIRLSPKELSKILDVSLPKQGLAPEVLLQDMRQYLKFTPNTLTPHFQNQLFSGLQPYALAGEWLSVFTNSTMATFEVAPVATLMEQELIQHFNKKIGWTSGEGIMVTGGSNANFSAMLVARNTLYPKTKIEGNGSHKFVAFVSEEAHYSFDKAVNMLGLGLNALRKVPSDSEGRMIPGELQKVIELSVAAGETPFFIGATAGTTVLGAFDPIDKLSEIAKAFGLWLHVDGAWGGSVIFSSKHQHLVKGLINSDSLTLDTHKMLGTGLISSFFLTRHSQVLRKSNDSGGQEYIFHDSEASSFDTGPRSLQCGRRVDSLKVWLMWRSLGDEGVELIVDRLFELVAGAKKFIQSQESLVLLHDPEMLNICFSFRDPKVDVKAAREKLLSSGNFYVNISTRRGMTFFRMILVNPELTSQIIEDAINQILKAGHRL